LFEENIINDIGFMLTGDNIHTFDFDTIPIESFWNSAEEKELKIHQIHSYPAKFPAFVTTKAIDYAKGNGVIINTVADIFCGCGTTAFEAKRNNIDYWGCDINPVATMIARTKSRNYQLKRIKKYYKSIISKYKINKIPDGYNKANERLRYWFSEQQYNKLQYIKSLIIENTPSYSDYYRCFFLCAFSNILKGSSVWLTKSIKPQVDPNKNPIDAYILFKNQCNKMFFALEKAPALGCSKNKIITGNFLDDSIQFPETDMIITSPPYVVSYEYADLHQLSSLWLDFADDYRVLRNGTIGSLHHIFDFTEEKSKLNITGNKVVNRLMFMEKSKAKAVAKYFLDMQNVINKTYRILNKKGMSLFIIGNTEYKGVKIENARHLAEAMLEAGYKEIFVSKRKISQKILTPYRDKKGKFTADPNGRKVYNEEYIISGRK
jgi:methylase of polypeptide subunit release factors